MSELRPHEDMIGKIIELDRRTREEAVKTSQLKVNLEQKIGELKEKKRAQYVEKAREDIKELEKDEKIKACIKLSAIEGIHKKKIERIEKIYSSNKDQWIQTIVGRII